METIRELLVDIIDCPVTGKKRKLKHRQLRILPDLEMVHDVEIIYFENVDGEYGQPMTIAILGYDLSEDQKKRQLELFKNKIVTATTKGAFVDPTTGELVEEGGIPEILFFQNVPLSVFVGATKASEVFYAMIQQSMSNMDSNNRF
jgi:hypothetical protein